MASAAVSGNFTFTVTSTADTPDATPGNGVCADTSGSCTLRAAMTEASWDAGNDIIGFNLLGIAPVTIAIGSQLPNIGSRAGTVTIDGYTQPGSQPNTATFGTNAVQGVEIKGPGVGALQNAFYVASMGNTIRGLLIDDVNRAVFIDHSDAHDNRIVGNWIGFRRDGSLAGLGQYGVVLNNGANHDVIGTTALADRNLIGNVRTGVDEYGAGTDANVIQNNVFCIRPGGGKGNCYTGIDHNFGPKNGLIGGSGPGQLNVIGPTILQGIEYSHGWDPSNHTYTSTWAIDGNQAIGNWVGFRWDGNYDPAYRSGLNFSNSDNDQGINCYDGTNNSTISGNYIASVFDGIQVESPNAIGNVVRDNVIGVSPLGQPAPLTGWGIKVRWSARHDTFQGNTIRNAAAGGIGLLKTTNTGNPISVAYNIRLTRNIITDTNGPAIDLFGVAGPDPNDPGDADDGANTLLNTPIFVSATATLVSGTAVPGATVELYRASRPAGSYGLPAEYLGSAVANGAGSWAIPVTIPTGTLVTALQIRTDDNTSELAANVAVK